MKKATGLSLAFCSGMLVLKIVYDITRAEWWLHSFFPFDHGYLCSSPTHVIPPILTRKLVPMHARQVLYH